MPRKPRKPCAYPGCPELTEGRYCDKHKKEESKNYERFKRDKRHGKNYGRKWKELRTKYVKEHPFCEECYKNGRLVPVEEVHHIIPLREGGKHSEENLISLCRSCHARKHSKIY